MLQPSPHDSNAGYSRYVGTTSLIASAVSEFPLATIGSINSTLFDRCRDLSYRISAERTCDSSWLSRTTTGSRYMPRSRPSKRSTFGTFPRFRLQSTPPGEPLLFKLHSPRNFIAGGGFFAKFVPLPLSLAWEAFGIGNGVYSLEEGRRRISKYRRMPIGPQEDPNIGCIVLAEPFFFPQELWIPMPSDFSLTIVRGKGYDTEDS